MNRYIKPVYLFLKRYRKSVFQKIMLSPAFIFLLKIRILNYQFNRIVKRPFSPPIHFCYNCICFTLKLGILPFAFERAARFKIVQTLLVIAYYQ